MNRRTFLTTVSSIGIISISGCSNSSKNTDKTTITDYSFEIVTSEDISNTKITKISENKLQIRGRIKVKNGCQSLKLTEKPSISGTNPVTGTVSIKSYRDAEDTAMCTQVIKPVMYKLTLTYTGPDIQEIDLSYSGVKSKKVNLSVGK